MFATGDRVRTTAQWLYTKMRQPVTGVYDATESWGFAPLSGRVCRVRLDLPWPGWAPDGLHWFHPTDLELASPADDPADDVSDGPNHPPVP